jgi:hypothetical protein
MAKTVTFLLTKFNCWGLIKFFCNFLLFNIQQHKNSLRKFSNWTNAFVFPDYLAWVVKKALSEKGRKLAHEVNRTYPTYLIRFPCRPLSSHPMAGCWLLVGCHC